MEILGHELTVMSWTRSKLFIPISLTLITLGALTIRLAGVNFGLPQAYHVDEHFYYPAAWSMGQGQLDLPNQSHGPSLYLFTLLIGQWIIKAISFPQLSPVDFGRLIDTNPWPFLISARAVSVLAGALTIPCVFWLGRRYRDQRIGLAAAALMAILFFYVRDSHFGVPDSFMTLFVAAAAWLALRSYQTQARRDFILAGLMAGIATAAKYTSAFIFIPVILAAFHALPNTSRSLRSILLASGGFFLGFIIGYPNIVINLPAFIKDISFLWVRVGSGYEGWSIMPDNSPLYYLNTLMWGIGLPMLILSAIGIGVAIASRKMSEWIIIAFPIIYIVALSLSRGHFGRYLLPILPMLCVFTADICLRSLPNLWARITRQVTAHPGHLAGLIGSFIFAGVFIPNLAQSIRLDWILSQADTRTLAKDWIEVNIPAGTRIAVEWPFHTPPLSNG
ncbi:MAG TPA: glycosyltransferase family 39 protein, partial [Anaerolineae bacterium]|nr:glycosyltransferase family 39 protein [Anaerolineae bacterium]